MYLNCRWTYTPRDSDSIRVDSLDMEGVEQDIVLDEEGNATVKPQEPAKVEPQAPATPANGEATEPKKKAQPQYEDVYF